MKPIKPAEMVKVLQKAGFSFERQTGSHQIFSKPVLLRPISVPFHVKDLPTETQRAILRQAEISLEDFEKLLTEI